MTPHPYPLSEPLPGIAGAEEITIVDDGAKVEHLMHRGVIGCAPGETAARVAEIMIDEDVNAVVVMDGGQAVGVVSQTDLVLARQTRSVAEARAVPVRDIMTPGCVTCEADQSLTEAVSLMTGRRMHRLVVTDKGQPVGVLSMTDVVRKLILD